MAVVRVLYKPLNDIKISNKTVTFTKIEVCMAKEGKGNELMLYMHSSKINSDILIEGRKWVLELNM